jgi:hypothetical protein
MVPKDRLKEFVAIDLMLLESTQTTALDFPIDC